MIFSGEFDWPVVLPELRLKDQDGGDLALFGGATIAAAFMRHDLVDEFASSRTPSCSAAATSRPGWSRPPRSIPASFSASPRSA